MEIDIWSDIACPFCYIGKRNLDMALKEWDSDEEIEIIFHSFQLDPEAKKDGKTNSVEQLAQKYGSTKEQAQEMIDRVVGMAKNVGLYFNYERLIETNTFDSHRLIHFARKFGKDNEVTEQLLKAHFTDGLDIGDMNVLAEVGDMVGLNSDEIINMLKTDEFYSEVDNDKYKAGELEISSVPFFIFNNKYAISGAQPTKAFIETLKKAKE